MAENLNYYDTLAIPSLKDSSFCFDNKEENCNVAGRFYMRPFDGICPENFQVPSYKEYNELYRFLKEYLKLSLLQNYTGNYLKTKFGWVYKMIP